MNNHKTRIRAVLSALLSAAVAMQSSISAFAEYQAPEEEPQLQCLTIVESEPSEYGEQDVYYLDENGEEVSFDLVPDGSELPVNGANLPSYYNLNEMGYVTSVKNQGSTGTCWAHAALSAAESSMIKRGITNRVVDLSEAHLVWFSEGQNTPENDPLYGDPMNLGVACYDRGGNDNIAIGALSSWMGAVSESSYPAVTDTPIIDESHRYDSKYHLQNAVTFDASDRSSIKEYLMKNGAMTLAYHSINQYYKNEDSFTSFYQNQYTQTNHAVTLVGWDDDFSADNFAITPPGNGAWIIKNSWGTWWGKNGYFYISYYDTSVSQIWSYEMEDTSNYTGIYQRSMTARPALSYSNNTITGSNVFTAVGSDPLTAVSFFTSEASIPYEINICVGVNNKANPMSGTIALTQSGTATYAGYHTVKLNKDITIPEGTKFSVSVTLNKTGTAFWCDSYAPSGYTSFVNYNINNANSWIDVSTSKNYNTAIKAFTKSNNPIQIPQKPQNVKAEAGDGCVTLSWDAITGASAYAVSIYENGAYNILTSTLTDTSYVVGGLTNGRSYEFLVQACVNGVWSSFSPADHVACTPIGESKPRPSAIPGDGCVTLSWDAITGASAYAVSIYENGAYNILTSTLTDTSYVIGGLTNGRSYEFLVQACVNGVWSSFSPADHVACTPIGESKPRPSTIPGDRCVTLSWDAITGASAYAVSIYENGAYNILTSTLTDTSYVVGGLTNGRSYEFLVQACVNGVWSSFSPADHVACTPIGESKPRPSTIPGDGCVTLSWDAITGASAYAVSIYENGAYNILTSTLTDTSYVVGGLTNGRSYEFLVQACVNGVWSSFSPADHVACTPIGESKPRPSTIPGDGCVTLSWDAITGASAYAVSIYENGAYNILTSTLTDTSYVVGGLTNGRSYEFLVQACVNGVWSSFSPADHVACTPIGESKPRPSTIPGDGCVTLSWDAITGASAYAVSIYENGAYNILTSTLTDTSYVVGGLTNGRSYEFLVQACVNGVWSSFSPADHVACTPIGESKPRPSAIPGDGCVTLSWDAITGASAYAVSIYENGAYNILTSTLTDTSYVVGGLTNGRSYEFLVQACVNGVWSSFSPADHVACTPIASIG